VGIKTRDGLQQLLREVVGGEAQFKVILVYDVSRWGRFQDLDEAAHYKFMCKSGLGNRRVMPQGCTPGETHHTHPHDDNVCRNRSRPRARKSSSRIEQRYDLASGRVSVQARRPGAGTDVGPDQSATPRLADVVRCARGLSNRSVDFGFPDPAAGGTAGSSQLVAPQSLSG
jgi:hypothetical protein